MGVQGACLQGFAAVRLQRLSPLAHRHVLAQQSDSQAGYSARTGTQGCRTWSCRPCSRVASAGGCPETPSQAWRSNSELTAAWLRCRDDLLQQAGSLGGTVNPGSNQTVFQATVPDNALRAGLAQIPRGQARPRLFSVLSAYSQGLPHGHLLGRGTADAARCCAGRRTSAAGTSCHVLYAKADTLDVASLHMCMVAGRAEGTCVL